MTDTYKPSPDVPLEINPADDLKCPGCGRENGTYHDPDCEVALAAIARLNERVPQPKAPELLGRAAALMHERGKTYDQPEGERSMGKAVEAFNAITGRNLRESEGWLFMSLLKLVRSETRSEPHQDSLEDNIAYSALYAEARGEGR